MFDYFRNMRQKQLIDDTGKLQNKPKKDKVFIGILIVFGLIIVISIITGIANVGKGMMVQKMNYRFQFHISDGVLLVGLVLTYLIVRYRKRRK